MKEGIVKYVDQFLADSESKLQPFIVSGMLNREYLRGNQNRKVDQRRMTIVDKKKSTKLYQETKSFNRMFPIYLTRYGILSSNRPIPGFKTSNRAKSVSGALEGNNFIAEFSKEVNLKEKYNTLIRLGDTDGLAWIKTGIDWTKGDLISVKKKLKIKDEDTQKTDNIEVKIKEGRPFIDIVPIHEVFVDNLTIDSSTKINELVYRRPFSCDFIENRFGKRPDPEPLLGQGSSHPYYSELGFNMRGKKNAEYAYVKEYYKRADAVYPLGRFVLIAGDIKLHDGPLPYENGVSGKRTIPFIPVSLQTVPGHIVGPTVYNQIIPMQDTYNSTKNRMLEYVNHIAIGQLYYWEGSLVNKSSFINKPGRMIGLKRNARPPQPVQKDKIGVEFIQYMKTIEEDMLVASGLSAMQAFGQSKSNMRTDGVVDKIADADSNKLSNAVDNLSLALIEAFKQVFYLEMYRQQLLGETYEVAGADDYMVKYKLREVDPEELVIVNREFLDNSDVTLEKKMAQAVQLGVYNPQAGLSYRSKMEMLDAINSGYLKTTLDPTERLNHELILMEQEDILELKSPMVEEFHDHDQHVMEHNLFRLSPHLRQMKRVDPEKYEQVKQALDAHIDQHQQLLSSSAANKNLENAKAFI